MKRPLGILTALVLVINQFFSYPAKASEYVISGNGADSNNLVTATQHISRRVFQNNGLKLTNHISIHANTGDNEALGNDGNVTIATGQVNIKSTALNLMNSSGNSITGTNPNPKVSVADNGSSSAGKIDDNFSDEEEYIVNNNLELSNKLNIYVDTGGNKAAKNQGNLFISTGNIYLNMILSNRANTSINPPINTRLRDLLTFANPLLNAKESP